MRAAELRDALAPPERPVGTGGAGAGPLGSAPRLAPEGLTLTVEEAAQLLGISRAFAY